MPYGPITVVCCAFLVRYAKATSRSGARRGLFYRPVKQQLTLRLDADVVAWFKQHARPNEGYQTRINRALREYVQGRARRRSRG
jgi:uncharacterized protein (DUF4415 family)